MILMGLKITLCVLGLFHAADIGVEFERDNKRFTPGRVIGFICAIIVVITGAFL